MQIENTPISSIMDVLTIGGLITISVVAYQFYLYIKRTTKKEADFTNLVTNNKKEVKDLSCKLIKMELDNEVSIKEIWVRMDKDKDTILTKIEEVDKKADSRFNNLTELIIDLFKNK